MTYLDCIILQIIFSILILLGIFSVCYFIYKEFLSYYQDWKAKRLNQKLVKEREELFQQLWDRVLQEQLHRKEKEDYPLFFLKGGIV